MQFVAPACLALGLWAQSSGIGVRWKVLTCAVLSLLATFSPPNGMLCWALMLPWFALRVIESPRTERGTSLLPLLIFAGLAVLLSICSEADAFVAAGLPQFSLTSRLVFLVVGPVIDLKLIALHAGVFGRRFAMIFAPVTLVVAVLSAVVVGRIFL